MKLVDKRSKLWVGMRLIDTVSQRTHPRVTGDIVAGRLTHFMYAHDEDHCSVCTACLSELTQDLSQRADYWGMDSLTEQEQAFLEDTKGERCPDCIEHTGRVRYAQK